MNNINNLLEYINKSPENTNPAIVKSIIESEYDSGDFEPETVTGEGDVSITYNGNQIGVLSESGTLTLDTDGKVVEHDIVVEYTKPAAGISVPEISGSYPDDIIISAGSKGEMVYEVNNKIVDSGAGFTKQYIIPHYDTRDGLYTADIVIYSDTDTLNVTINNTTVPFNRNAYPYRYSSVNYPEGFTIVVTNK